MSRLESMAEKMLREAIEGGEFDDLPGKGQPVDLSQNPFEDPDLRVVHKLLREAAWERNVAEFREKAAELNSRIRLYNLKVPSAVFQRGLFDTDRVIEGIAQAND